MIITVTTVMKSLAQLSALLSTGAGKPGGLWDSLVGWPRWTGEIQDKGKFVFQKVTEKVTEETTYIHYGLSHTCVHVCAYPNMHHKNMDMQHPLTHNHMHIHKDTVIFQLEM